MLWGRAANRCAICRMELVMDASETDDESLVGEACHIVAQSINGPRGIADLTQEQRDKFANLILLCNVHHKVIDDQPTTYTVEQLLTTKANHELWVRRQLNFDQQKQKDDEIYAEYVEDWAAQVRLNDWLNWTSWLLSGGQPSISLEMKDALEEVSTWLLSRIWPGRYPEIESAFQNFLHVTQDFCLVFKNHAKKFHNFQWQTERFYKIDEWDPARYKILFDKFEEHVDLVQDLVLELTRAANFVCDMVRQHLIRTFRLKEGVILTQGGPYMDLTVRTYRVEYGEMERIDPPYPGLEMFKQVRFTRDRFFGEPPKTRQITPADGQKTKRPESKT